MRQSGIYIKQEADAWFQRAGHKRFHHVEYPFEVLDRKFPSIF